MQINLTVHPVHASARWPRTAKTAFTCSYTIKPLYATRRPLSRVGQRRSHAYRLLETRVQRGRTRSVLIRSPDARTHLDVRCSIIKSSPERSPPADNRQKSPRAAARGHFSGGILKWGDLWGRRYFNKGRHIKSVTISPWADFSRGKHFSVTRL